MGDRSNIVVSDGESEVWLYGHWMGSGHINILRSALMRAIDRWDDPAYLTRIIFCEMVKDDVDGVLGFGIWTYKCDNEYPVLYVHCDKQTVSMDNGDCEMPIKEFIKDFNAFDEIMERYYD